MRGGDMARPGVETAWWPCSCPELGEDNLGPSLAVQGREGLTGSWKHLEVAGAVGPSFGVWGVAASRSPGGTRGLCAHQRGLDDWSTGTSSGGNSHAWLRVAVTGGAGRTRWASGLCGPPGSPGWCPHSCSGKR